MQDVILHYDWPQNTVEKIPTSIAVMIGGKEYKLYLSMCYWRPDYMTYHVEYTQMED